MKLVNTLPPTSVNPNYTEIYQSEYFNVLDFCAYIESNFIVGPNSENKFVTDNKEKRPEVLNELQEHFNFLKKASNYSTDQQLYNLILENYNYLVSRIRNISANDIINGNLNKILDEKVTWTRVLTEEQHRTQEAAKALTNLNKDSEQESNNSEEPKPPTEPKKEEEQEEQEV